jgi:hypothetical protein
VTYELVVATDEDFIIPSSVTRSRKFGVVLGEVGGGVGWENGEEVEKNEEKVEWCGKELRIIRSVSGEELMCDSGYI